MATKIEITPEVDRALSAIFDAALRHSGLAIMPSIDTIRGMLTVAAATAVPLNGVEARKDAE